MDPPDDQGFLSSGCPFCQVLHSDLSTCPRCDGQTEIRAAQMLDAESVRRAVAAAVTAYDGSRTRLEELLQVLFTHRPTSIAALAEDSRITLEQLRLDDARTPR